MMASILSTMTLQSTQLQSCSVPGMDLLGLRLSQTVVKRTHGYPLSSALHTSLPYWEAENGASHGYNAVVCVTRRPAGFCRRRLTSMVLHSKPRGSLYAETFTAIKADLEAFSPGRVPSGSRRPRPACGRRASFSNIHVQMTHTTSQ